MMSLSSARSQRRNLRGASSSSAASGSIAALHSPGTSTASGSYLSASSGSSGATGGIPFEEVEPMKLNVKMDDLQVLTEQHILKLQPTDRKNTEIERLEKRLYAIAKIRTNMRKKEQTDDMIKEYSRLKGVLIHTLNESQ
jgi:hypothetical protein